MIFKPAAEWAVIILPLGVGLFFHGVFQFLRWRLTSHGSLSKANSLMPGLCELEGTATGKEILIAPISQQPCVWWSYRLQTETAADDERWRHVTYPTYNESSTLPVFIEDDTGQTMLVASGVSFDCPKTKLSRWFFSSNAFNNAYERLGLNRIVSGFIPSLMRQTLVELRIPPDAPIHVRGEIKEFNEPFVLPATMKSQGSFRDYIVSVKKNAAELGKADTNQDGQISQGEWAEFLDKKRTKFGTSQAAQAASQSIKVSHYMGRPDDEEESFLISVGTRAESRQRMLSAALPFLGLGATITYFGVLNSLDTFGPVFDFLIGSVGLVAAYFIYKNPQMRDGRMKFW